MAGCALQVSGCALRVARYGLHVTSCGSRVTVCEIQVEGKKDTVLGAEGIEFREEFGSRTRRRSIGQDYGAARMRKGETRVLKVGN